MRCRILFTFLVGLLALLPSAAQDRPPNIVVILADDLGQCDMTLYDGWIQTPRLAQMAKEGLLFTDFHTNSSVCSPTRAAFLTGRYQQRAGIVDVIVGSREPDQGLHPDTPIISRVFKDNGYATALFGKWHCGYQDKYNPIHHGFDEFVGFLNGGADFHLKGGWRNGIDKAKDLEGYGTHVITDMSVDFIKRNKDKPFFLYVSHQAVHNPYQTIEDTPENRDKDLKQHAINDRNRVKYEWMLKDLDKGVGEILDTLSEEQIAENTLVFFFSDNGAVPMAPKEFHMWRGRKFSQYEGGHRVPAIAWWPSKIKPNTTSDALVLGFDLFPTFTDIAGLSPKTPNNLDGTSFKDHLLEQKPFPNRDIFFGYEPKLGTALRSGPWKMIVKGEDHQLYNLDDDPGEMNNIVEKHPNQASKMLKAIEEFKTTVTQGS